MTSPLGNLVLLDTTGNEVNLSLDSVSNRVGGIVRSGGTYYTTNYVVTDTTQVNKVALKYEGSDVKLFVNGVFSRYSYNGICSSKFIRI